MSLAARIAAANDAWLRLSEAAKDASELELPLLAEALPDDELWMGLQEAAKELASIGALPMLPALTRPHIVRLAVALEVEVVRRGPDYVGRALALTVRSMRQRDLEDMLVGLRGILARADLPAEQRPRAQQMLDAYLAEVTRRRDAAS